MLMRMVNGSEEIVKKENILLQKDPQDRKIIFYFKYYLCLR